MYMHCNLRSYSDYVVAVGRLGVELDKSRVVARGGGGYADSPQTTAGFRQQLPDIGIADSRKRFRSIAILVSEIAVYAT